MQESTVKDKYVKAMLAKVCTKSDVRKVGAKFDVTKAAQGQTHAETLGCKFWGEHPLAKNPGAKTLSCLGDQRAWRGGLVRFETRQSLRRAQMRHWRHDQNYKPRLVKSPLLPHLRRASSGGAWSTNCWRSLGAGGVRVVRLLLVLVTGPGSTQKKSK